MLKKKTSHLTFASSGCMVENFPSFICSFVRSSFQGMGPTQLLVGSPKEVMRHYFCCEFASPGFSHECVSVPHFPRSILHDLLSFTAVHWEISSVILKLESNSFLWSFSVSIPPTQCSSTLPPSSVFPPSLLFFVPHSFSPSSSHPLFLLSPFLIPCAFVT